jgi:hypothetical protein
MNTRISARVASALICMALAVIGLAGDPILLSAKTSWGFNGDGWWAPGENGITYLATDSNQRSMAYNPATGHVLLVNALSVRILDGTSGASLGLLGTTGITGGDRALNQVGVTSDGQIYGSNLRVSNSSTASYKVYRWNDESSANTTEFNGLVRTGGRLGDSLDVWGSGANVQVGGGFGSTGNGYYILSGQFGMVPVDYPVAGTTGGDFRLGFAFRDSDTVYGTQNATSGTNGVRISTFNGTTAALDGTITLAEPNERAVDFAVVNGRTIMATIQSTSNMVRVYDITSNPTSGSLTPAASLNLTTSFTANTNATSDVAFGAVTGDMVCLYALNTNNGIQAFNVQVVPEPATMIAIAAGCAAMIRRRRQ